MARSDAAIVADWTVRLHIREGLLDYARREHTFWSARWRSLLKAEHGHLPGSEKRAHAYQMTLDRRAKVAHREAQVADARDVIARHSKPSMREQAFAAAVAKLGVHEAGGNNRGHDVEAIIKAAGGYPGEAWCGDFVAYCYLKAGSKSVTRAWAYVPTLEQLLTHVKNPAQGHVVIYNWDGGVADHTGLFDRWEDRDAGTFWAIEGNTGTVNASDPGRGEGVHRKLRHTSEVQSFRRVLR